MAGIKHWDVGGESSHTGLKAEGLSKKYKGFWLKDISLDIPPGSILGLLGKNGAGKTTMIKILAGHTPKNSGKIWVNGMDMGKAQVEAQSQIGFVLDGPMFLETRSLWGNGMAFGRFYPGFTAEGWKKWLSVFGLQGTAKLRELSKGERVKFQFAFAVAHHPRVLLLDEPTGNLDPVSRKEFLDILLDVVEEEQISVLFSSHITSDLEKTADQIALLEQGKLLYTGSMERLLGRFCLIKGGPEDGKRLQDGNYPEILGIRTSGVGFEALVDRVKAGLLQEHGETSNDGFPTILGTRWGLEDGLLCEETDLSKWMYYMTTGGSMGMDKE